MCHVKISSIMSHVTQTGFHYTGLFVFPFDVFCFFFLMCVCVWGGGGGGGVVSRSGQLVDLL